jgi:hypothetical protein
MMILSFLNLQWVYEKSFLNKISISFVLIRIFYIMIFLNLFGQIFSAFQSKIIYSKKANNNFVLFQRSILNVMKRVWNKLQKIKFIVTEKFFFSLLHAIYWFKYELEVFKRFCLRQMNNSFFHYLFYCRYDFWIDNSEFIWWVFSISQSLFSGLFWEFIHSDISLILLDWFSNLA